MKKYLSLQVWSVSEVVLGILTAMVILALPRLLPIGVFSFSAAIAGIFGAVVLRHFSLHGWSLLRGTVSQRAVLVAFWLSAVLVGGVLATTIGL